MTTPESASKKLLVSLGLLMVAAVPVEGQYVEPGSVRAVITDVSGAAVTSGDQVAGLFGPGSVQTFSCPTAWGVRTTAESLITELGGVGIRVSLPGQAVMEVTSAAMQTRLLELLTDEDADEAEAWLTTALSTAGNDSRSTRRAAARLAADLTGLLSRAVQMDPAEPGYRPASDLAAAVGSFNQLVTVSSAPFLANPPGEFLAVRAILSRLVVASLEHEGRTEYAAASDRGFACAPPLPMAATPVEPSPEPVTVPPVFDTALEICRLVDGRPTQIPVIIEGATLDSVVVLTGVRRALNEVYPDTTVYAAEQDWYIRAEPVQIEGRAYDRWGVPFIPRPPNHRRIGEYRGVPLLAGEEGPPESMVYLPVGPGCLMQEYRTLDSIRRIRG